MRLLLAEDEHELSDALCAILKHNHYSVDPVYDGQEALDYIRHGQYDGAILDIMMPKMDGLTVLRQVRESGNGIPILLLTAKSQVDDRIRGLDMGADDYLVKPFAMGELLARIRAMTRRRTEAATNLLRFGDLALSRETFNLSGPVGEQRLGNKEFQILELMMEHPNRVIPTDQCGSISPGSEKGCRQWGAPSRSRQTGAWATSWQTGRRCSDSAASAQIYLHRDALPGLGYPPASRLHQPAEVPQHGKTRR